LSNFIGFWDPSASLPGDAAHPSVAALWPLAIDGLNVRSDEEVTFAHARLDTVPGHAAENQPVLDVPRSRMLVGSIRLDNLPEIARETGLSGDEVTDAHAVLAAYGRWGADVTSRIRGDFAFLIWDRHARSIFGARDHLGIRPLYLASRRGLLAAGSSLAAVVAHPRVARRVETDHLEQLLRSDIADSTLTAWRGVERLQPGGSFLADLRAGTLRTRRFWAPRRASHIASATREDLDEVRSTLEDAVDVRLRMRTTDRFACEVSGGLDSAMIAGLASRAAQPGQRPHALTLTLPHGEDAEGAHARSVAAYHRLEQSTFEIETPGSAATMAERTQLLAEPLLVPADHAQDALTVWLQDNRTRIALTGRGGDQVFDLASLHVLEGLQRDPLRTRRRLRSVYGPDWPRGLAADLVPLAPAPVRHAIRRLREARAGDPPDAPPRRAVSSAVSYPRLLRRMWEMHWLDGHTRHTMDQHHVINAHHGVEQRHPFYDVRLVELASRLRFDQGRHQPYRAAQRSVGADLLPPGLRTRRRNSDYLAQNLARARGFDRSLATFERLRELEIIDAGTLERAASLCFNDPKLADGRTVWLTLNALACELWLRSYDA
jgi:asparagine synthase (glutamine-hydrolysing)